MSIIFNIAIGAIKGIYGFLRMIGFNWWFWLYLIPHILSYDTSEAWLNFTIIISLCQLACNIYQKVKHEPHMNVLKFAFLKIVTLVKTGVKGNKKGFEAKTDKVTKDDLNGVIFGKDGKNWVQKELKEDGHILIMGGAGSGKTASIGLMTLNCYGGRVFAVDIKGELYNKTYRPKSLIKRFNPMLIGEDDIFGYDPFYMLKNSSNVVQDVTEIVQSLIPITPEEKEPFWKENAQAVLEGAILYYHEMYNDMGFSEMIGKIAERPIRELMQEIMKSDNRNAKIIIKDLVDLSDQTLSSITSTLAPAIRPFATDTNLIQALSGKGNVLTPADLENGYDIFLQIPEDKIEQWKTMLNLMVNQFMKFFERRSDGDSYPILFMLDEFPRLGKINSVVNGLTTLRSKHIQIMMIIQSLAQLNVNYGKDVAKVVTDNCNYQAVLSATDPESQEWCSKKCGTYMEQRTSTNTGNSGKFGIKNNSSDGTTKSFQRDKIIQPEEFGYLPQKRELIYYSPSGWKRLKQVRWYECEKMFTAR